MLTGNREYNEIYKKYKNMTKQHDNKRVRRQNDVFHLNDTDEFAAK